MSAVNKRLFPSPLLIGLCCSLVLCCAGNSYSSDDNKNDNQPTSIIQLALNPPPHINSLTRNEARSIFSMRVRVWPDGSPITVVVMPDSNPLHSQFVRQLLTLLPHQLRRNWNRMVYTGIGQAPVEVTSEAAMLQLLQTTPGSIGYLRQGIENDKVHSLKLL